MTPLLELKQVGFNYETRQVLRGVSLTLEEGSCTALVGPNGAGKTTLLRIVSGALAATEGLVLLEGQPLTTFERRQRSKLIALVPQQLDVPFDFSVQQIVEQGRTPYLGRLRGLTREDHAAVDQALERTDIFRLRHRIFNELSGGERQRVKVALGLAQQPRLLLLDEPTQNLDIGRQAELIDLLHQLRSEGLTIFASMHDLHLVPGNFSAVHLLEPNQPMMSGSPEEILTTRHLTQAFRCAPGRHPLLAAEPARQVLR